MTVVGTVERREEFAFALEVSIPELPEGDYLLEAEATRPESGTHTDTFRIIQKPA